MTFLPTIYQGKLLKCFCFSQTNVLCLLGRNLEISDNWIINKPNRFRHQGRGTALNQTKIWSTLCNLDMTDFSFLILFKINYICREFYIQHQKPDQHSKTKKNNVKYHIAQRNLAVINCKGKLHKYINISPKNTHLKQALTVSFIFGKERFRFSFPHFITQVLSFESLVI